MACTEQVAPSAAAPAATAPPEAAQLIAEARQALVRGEWAEARAMFQRVLGIDSRYHWPFVHIGFATIARAEGRAHEGLVELGRAAALLQGLDAAQPIVDFARCQLQEEYGKCYLALGLMDRAAEAFIQQGRLAQRMEPMLRYGAATALIDLRLAQRDWQAALQRCEAALLDSQTWAEVMPKAVAGLVMRRLFAQGRMTKDPAALRGLAAALDALIEDHALSDSLVWRATFESATMSLDGGTLDRAHEKTTELLAGTFDRVALEAEARALHARVQIARDVAPEDLARQRQALVAVVERLFDEWRKSPIRSGGVGSFHFGARRNVIRTLLALDRRVLQGEAADAAAFAHMEAALALGTLSRRAAAASPDLSRVRAELVPAGGGVLVYITGWREGHLLAIDADGVEQVEFTIDEAFEADMRHVEAAVNRPPKDTSASAISVLRESGDRLVERILPPPVRARVERWKRLLVIGDEQIAAGVWNALPWKNSWLALHLPIAHVPSAALAMHLRARAAAKAGPGARQGLDLAIVGDPEQSSATTARWSVEPLALDVARRDALLAPLAAGRARAWWRAEATEAVLRLPLVASAQMLCVLAHGVQQFERELFAGLLLAPADDSDGVLFADEVEALAVARLVVLAACNASAGPLRVGDDGAHHLGGAFLTAGASAVVLASGELSLGATLDLLRALFAELASGVDTAEALRRARVAVAADPARAHPYFFAGLRLMGLDQNPIR